jgi:putative ABC transport system permease protein
LLSAEGIVLGSAGAAIGAGLGIALAAAAAGLFSQSVTALYAPAAASVLRISTPYLAAGCALGVIVSWLASLAPARGALRLAGGIAATSPSRERARSALRLAVAGLFGVAAGFALPVLDLRLTDAQSIANLVLVSDALVLIGLGLATPLVLLALSPLMRAALRGPRLLIPKLAWSGVAGDPARSAMVVAAVLLGSAYVIITVAGVASIREGVLGWMRGTQHYDLVVAATGSIGNLPSSPAIPGDLGPLLRAQPGVAKVEASRVVAQPFGARWVVISARSPAVFGERQPVRVTEGDIEAARRAMHEGEGAIVSRILAARDLLHAGDRIELRSPSGPVPLRIGAVIDDYNGGDLGTVFVEPRLYRERWRDAGATAYEIWLEAGVDPVRTRNALSAALAGRCACGVLTRNEVRERSAGIVDAVFYTAYALELVAAFVMVVSMVGFFVITLAERAREIALLHGVGATRRQIVATFLCEAVALGLVGGVLGSVAGLVLCRRFIEGALRSGLGLVFDLVVPPEVIAVVLAVSVAVSVLAAATPVLRASRATSLLRAEPSHE